MPPPPAPTPPQDPKDNKGPDLSKILLPKKEAGPNPESAQRVDASALFAQEQAATLQKPAAPAAAPTPVAPAPKGPEVAPFQKPAAPPPPATPNLSTPTPLPEVTDVKPIQTYRADLEKVVTEKGVSVVSVAAAEAERRGKQPLSQEAQEEKDAKSKSYAMLAAGVLLVLIAIGVVAIIATRKTTVEVAQAPKAPFINIDDLQMVPIPPGQNDRASVMTSLTAARQKTKVPLGLIEWLYPEEPATTKDGAIRPIGLQELLGIIAPNAPQDLLRVLTGRYFIGIHSFDENQPFMLMQVDSYEVAYKAMLDWESGIRADLAPFFTRNPSPRQSGEPAVVSTTTPQFLQTGFVDRVVENRDTRVWQNDNGDILLLWTFLGRNLILVTTNEYTLREVLSRLNDAPIVPTPGK